MVDLYSAYLGKVSVSLLSDVEGDNFLLEDKLRVGTKDILVKVIDCKEHNLYPWTFKMGHF